MLNKHAKEIPGFSGIYLINKQGDVFTLDRINHMGRRLKGQIMTKMVDARGYYYVNLEDPSQNKKISLRIHRLVATLFVPNHNNHTIVGFKDNNKLHVSHYNIVWLGKRKYTRTIGGQIE
jgi:hypothetical protein